MKPPTRHERTGRELPAALERRFASYALAAGAAGVGLLAMAQPAGAQIVYTPTNVTLTRGRLFIDLNGDGINDFYLEDRGQQHATWRDDLLGVGAALGGGVVATNNRDAVAMNKGSVIGPGQQFKNVAGTMLMLSTGDGTTSSGRHISWSSGQWLNVRDRFLGLRFEIGGETHFGWARISVQSVHGTSITATLLGYAYEATAGKAITAGRTSGPDAGASAMPQAGSLGSLASGAAK
jgi:hypothetical protein